MRLALNEAAGSAVPDDPVDDEVLRVLLIDDDPGYRRLCKRYLSNSLRSKFDVVAVGTAAEGCQLCREQAFDCLLVDYVLPDQSGTQVLQTLQGTMNTAPPPTIILTAEGGEEAAADAVRAGAADFLPKRVVTAESLARAICNAVEKSRLQMSVVAQSLEIQQANMQLLRRNEEIQCFYQCVSHEVKTPLTATREFIAIVLDGITGPVTEKQKEMLSHALDSCDQINAHFNDLIEMTRLEAGKITLNKELSSLDTVVTRCFASAHATMIARQLHLQRDIDPSIPSFLFDSNRIVQVLSNLLGNAIKYSEAGGTITVSIRKDAAEEHIVISVSDTGCGIAQTDLPRIFDRLYQVHGDTDEFSGSGSGLGLGLGLSIARDIVELHGGDISVESVVDQGSKFSFRLPFVTHTNIMDDEYENCVAS